MVINIVPYEVTFYFPCQLMGLRHFVLLGSSSSTEVSVLRCTKLRGNWFVTFWDIVVVQGLKSLVRDTSTLEDRTTTLSRNIRNKLRRDAVSYPRGTDTLAALLRRPEAHVFSVLFLGYALLLCLVPHCHSLRKDSFSISFM